MSYDWSKISANLNSTGYESIYSAGYNYSQASSLKAAYTALSANALSAKSGTEATNVSSRLATLTNSMKSSVMSDVDPYAAWKTDDGKSTITALSKEAGKAMYEATTGTGTVVDEEA